MELEKGHLQYIIEHVFLPPRLPHAYDTETEGKDESLYKFVAEASEYFVEALELSQGISQRDLQLWRELNEMLERTTRIHQLHRLTKEDIDSALQQLKVGAALPLHIAAQNAGIIFRRVETELMTFEAFELSLPTEVITGTVGKVIQRFPSNPRLPFTVDANIISALANVLSYLSDTTMDKVVPTSIKGGSSHHEVRQTVSPGYITEALAGVIRACSPTGDNTISTPYIHKRINDHALWKSALKPWRRTPSLLLLKVALQSTLQEKGIDEAYGYKSFWTFMMSLIMEEALEGDKQIFTMDLLHNMNIKLARRLTKMGQQVEKGDVTPLNMAADTVHRVAEELETRWREVQDHSSSVVQWNQLEITSEIGYNVSFRNSQGFLRKVMDRRNMLATISFNYDSAMTHERLSAACAPRLPITATIPTTIQTREVDIGLFDFETWVKSQLPIWSASSARSPTDCPALYSIAEEYHKVASAEYDGDPERLSLMWLCLVDLWMALDKIVCDWCPLMTEYSPEIPTNFLDPLLLPDFDQMKRLQAVQLYLQNRHETARNHGGVSIFSNVNAPKSFSNQFFKSPHAYSLIVLETQIEEWSEAQKTEKLEEMQRKNEEYQSLMEEARSMECTECLYTDRRRGGAVIFGHAFWICKRCRKEAQARKCKIKPIEEALPDSRVRSRPIIFELQTPQPIAFWRDLTAVIVFPAKELQQKSDFELYPLESYYPLGQFFRSPFPDRPPVVGLASSRKSVELSHYGREWRCPVQEAEVLKKHAGNFRLFDRASGDWIKGPHQKDLRTVCAFPMEGPYRVLEQYTRATIHLPNTVIASISSCPTEIPVSEYVAFSQLRSGARMQWWNIMRAIRAQTLTFSEPSVVALVLQSIWQAECMGEGGVYREAHHELQDHAFGLDAGEELSLAVKSLGKNWKQYLYLAVLIALARRLLEVSPHSDVREKAKATVYAARALSKEWITTLVQSGFDEPETKMTNPVHNRQSVAAIAIVFRSTFDGLCGAFSSNEEATWFVYAGILAAADTSPLTTSLRRLARRNKRIALSMEHSLADFCLNDPSILHKAAALAWPGYIAGLPWMPLPSPAARWWRTMTKADKGNDGGGRVSRFVNLNILDGTLLVDGKMSDRLPTEYTNHNVYSALLQDHVFFDIRPSTMPGMVYQAHYRNSELHFALIEDDLLIRRRRGYTIEDYLLSTMLQEDLPIDIIDDHHHWYIDSKRRIEIRPISQGWEANNEKHWAVNLVKTQNTIHGKIRRRVASGLNTLLDPHSALYRSLSRALRPLEPGDRGLVVYKNLNDTWIETIIHMPRHDLSFQLTDRGLESVSIPGYVVSQTRMGIGCLFGLDTLLSLHPIEHHETALKILVPRGTLLLKTGLHGHPSLTIDVGDHGGYFAYDVDDLLGRLVGNRTIESDLYLVKLHAFTSSPLSDPLTRRSGVDEALDRLRTASCSSVLDISKEARKYLDEIAALTPRRTPYPPHPGVFIMETVEWNKLLPVSSQHPAFRAQVEAILCHWQELAIFHQQDDLVKGLESPEGMVHLSAREALHSHTLLALSETRAGNHDLHYESRDSLTTVESQNRERMAFHMASLTRQTSRQFPVCKTLPERVKSWRHVLGCDDWQWKDVHQWLKAPHIPEISDMWCTLYELCRQTSWPPPFEVTLAVGLLGFSDIPSDLLASLIAVMCDTSLQSPTYDCPSFDTIDLSQGGAFHRDAITQLLKACAKDITASNEYYVARLANETVDERMERVVSAYNKALDEQIEAAVDALEGSWEEWEKPEDDLPDVASTVGRRSLLDLSQTPALEAVEKQISSWWDNRAFLHYINLVKDVINLCHIEVPRPALYRPSHKEPTIQAKYEGRITLHWLMSKSKPSLNVNTKNPPPSKVDTQGGRQSVPELETLLTRLKAWVNNPFEREYLRHLRKSIEALEPPKLAPSLDQTSLTTRQARSWDSARALFDSIAKLLRPVKNVSKLISACGLWPAVTPIVLLRSLSIKERNHLPSEWFTLLIGYAIFLHDAKRYDRILRYHFADWKDQLALETYYQRNWDVSSHPDFILFEIDTNVTIRAAQAELALEMISPEGGKNAVMQLNMGEGKSSIIVPIVAATLGAKESVLPRVIVPRAQTKQQFQFLRRALTSLCDRPIVYLPFNRQLEFTSQKVAGIHNFLRNLAEKGGIWLCEPEQLLSLKLLGLDKMLRRELGHDNGANELVELQSWLTSHTQDILDESDEVLQTRQQVIYTVGTQKALDGAPRRWEIIQRLLGLLASYFVSLVDGGDVPGVFIEKDDEKIAGFPYLRIQSDAGRTKLEHFICRTFDNNEWSLPPALNTSAKDFVTSATPAEASVRLIEEYRTEDPQIKQTLLILRGMIHYDILLHGLKDKRWRVEYGLDLRRSRLAVPYRAKDFPSLRSEFGHPDVTILLTCLSYYYRGLDDGMIRQAVKRLLRSATPDQTYHEWLKNCATEIPEELQTIRGINMDDGQLLTANLFPFLRHNKTVIDFYLNSFVFPRQAREFPHKLLSSGWDLAAEKAHVTTGFSGTNDSRILLPTPITQVDRPAQLHTNAKVLSRLLLKENETVVRYPDNFKSVELLDRICELWGKPKVILDVGAQILDCTNLEFAQLWLEHYKEDNDIGAVVFFDEGGNMTVLNRDGSTVPFLDSPYANTLERCLVYLDDVHTRGTDLRLPPSQAVVTLGPRLTKDKLVQGCMRMRRLGDVHRLLFMASDEVVRLITDSISCSPTEITSTEVLIWTIREAWRQAQADLPAWVQQGKSFMKREIAWQETSRGGLSEERIRDLFCETEARTLEVLYGLNKETERDLTHGADMANNIGKLIAKRCKEFGLVASFDATILEEMEIELVHEKENEREVIEVPFAKPANHFIHGDVIRFIASGVIPPNASGFLQINEAFDHTSFKLPNSLNKLPTGLNHVFRNIRVTKEFSSTIIVETTSNPAVMDHFLRPVEWVVTSITSKAPIIVAVSPYEVDQLLPQIRNSTAVKLHLFAPRGNPFMRTFEDLDRFILPGDPPAIPLQRSLAMQLNLFAGSLYLRDHMMYKDVCAALRLQIDVLPPRLAKREYVDRNGYVKPGPARLELGFTGPGFKTNALPFLRKLFVLRRYGQPLGPSHMGKLLHGVKLHKGKNRDFDEE